MGKAFGVWVDNIRMVKGHKMRRSLPPRLVRCIDTGTYLLVRDR